MTWNNGGGGWLQPSGQTYSITFTATLNAPVQGNFASTMTVSDVDGAAPDNDPATAFETAIVSVGAPPALILGKTVSPTTSHTANPSQQYRYCITIYNTGTGPITINRVEDYRANGTLYVVGTSQLSVNGGGFAALQDPDVVNNTMSWYGGPAFPRVLPAGQNIRIRWNHVSPGLSSGVFNNSVCVFNANTSTNCTGPTAPLTVSGPVHNISKSVITPTPATLITGGTITYQITITNTGPSTGTATVTDTWTNGWTWVNNSTDESTNGAAFDNMPYFGEGAGPNPTRTWTGISVPAGGNVRIRFQVNVTNAWAAANPGVYPNNALVRDEIFTNNDVVVTGDTAPVTIGGAPQISIDKTVSPATVLSFQTVDYTIRVRNASTSTVSGIVNGITDTLPTGFTYQPGTARISSDGVTFGAPGSFQNPVGTTGTITWSGAPGFAITLAAGQERYLRFTVQASGAPGTYSNDASALGQNFVDVPTGPTAPVQVSNGPVLTIGKGAATPINTASVPGSAASVPAGGGPACYTVTINNTGFTAANNVSITDVLPTGFTYIGLSSDISTNGNPTTFTGNPATSPMPVYQVTGAAAVHLIGFSADARSTGVLLRWQTGTEWQNLGYNLYRREGDTGTLEPVNPALIGGLGTSATGGHFHYADATVQPGHHYTYWLEDVEFGAMLTRQGPLAVTVPTDDEMVRTAWSAIPVHLPHPTEVEDGEPPQPVTVANPKVMSRYLTVVSADDTGMELLLQTPQLTVQKLNQGTVVVLPGLPVTHDVGLPQLPEAVVPVSAPRDVPYRIEVLEKADPVVLEDLDLAVAPPVDGSGGEAGGKAGGGSWRPNPEPKVKPQPKQSDKPVKDDCNCPDQPAKGGSGKQAAKPGADSPALGKAAKNLSGGSHLQFAFGTLATVGDNYPAEMAAVTAAADLRHERLLQLKLYPVVFDLERQRLTQYRTMRVRLTFDGRTTLASQTPTGPWDRAMDLLGREYGLLHRWVTEPAKVTDSFQRFGDKTWRLKVTQSGMQRLTLDDLQAAGVDIDQPERLALRHGGQDVPLDRQIRDDQLSALVFFAPTAGSTYSDASHYWLTLADAPVPAMGARSVLPDPAGRAGGTVQSRLHLEENHLYWANKPVDEFTDHWYWDHVSPDHDGRTFPFDLAEVSTDPGESSSLKVSLRGLVNDPQVRTNNHVALKLNGQQISDLRWPGQTQLETTVGFANGLLQSGTSTLTVTTVNDTGTATPVIYVNAFDLSYWRHPAAADGVATGRFSRAEATTWSVGTFKTQPEADDVSDVAKPLRLHDVGFDAGAVSLTDPDPTFGHDYWIGEPGRMATPQIEAFAWRDDLHGATSGADYVVIAPAAFRSEAERLALHRGAQGLQTRVVDLEAIYDEFADGQPEPEAIQRFLRWAVANWPAPAPAYVVLMGDGHYDYRNHYGTSQPVVLPPLLRDHPEIGAVPDENALVSVVGDDELPDLMLGRLPVATVAEAAAMVDKLVAYDQAPVGDWHRQGLLVADTKEPAFGTSTASVAEAYGSMTWARHSVLEGEQVRSALGDGPGLTLYVGHGYTVIWKGGPTTRR